jgi:hypothetical protein
VSTTAGVIDLGERDKERKRKIDGGGLGGGTVWQHARVHTPSHNLSACLLTCARACKEKGIPFGNAPSNPKP